MQDETRERALAFFASLTADSRPMKPGVCPLLAAMPDLWTLEHATTASPSLAGAFDRAAKAKADTWPYSTPPWELLTAGECRAILEAA
jgi:hypothetical protein